MSSRRHYHTPRSKYYVERELRELGERGAVVAVLERAINEIIAGNFARAQGMLASQCTKAASASTG